MQPLERCKTQQKRARGVITVGFSLIFLLVLSMILGLLESTRIYAIQIRAQQALSGGLDSLFSMYDRSLFDRYGILMLNEDLLIREKGFTGLTDALWEGMRYDCSPNEGLFYIASPQYYKVDAELLSLDRVYYSMDHNGSLFVRDVMDLMKYYELANLTNSCISAVSNLVSASEAHQMVQQGGQALESEDWNVYLTTQETTQEETDLSEQETDPETASESTKCPTDEETTVYDINSDVQEALGKSVLAQFKEAMSGGLMELYGVDVDQLSDKRVDLAQAATAKHSFDSKGYPKMFGDIFEEGLFHEYILSFFSDYLTGMDNAALRYEVEYILQGSNSDRENLTRVLNRIYRMRLQLNSLAILSIKNRVQEAKETANKIVGWSGIPALIGATSWSMLEMMAVTESILDVRTLLAGEKIPYLKKEKDWSVTLENAMALLRSDARAKTSAMGMGYRGYLRVLLFMDPVNDKVRHTMNLIEWNLKMENPRFSMSRMIYAVETTVFFSADPLFSKAMFLFPGVLVPKKYRWDVKKARTY